MGQKNTDDFACPTSVCMPFRHRVEKSDIIVHNSCFILFLKLPWGTQTYLLKGNVTFLAECIWKQKPWLPIHILSEVLWWRPGALWIVSIDNYANPFQNGMMTSSSGKNSPLLALCAGNSLPSGEFPSQRPVTRSFDVFFYLRLNKRLGKQPMRRLFETPSRSLWRHCNVYLNCPSFLTAPVLVNITYEVTWQCHKKLSSFHSPLVLEKYISII